MKSILTFGALFFVTAFAQAQYTRSFYTTTSTGFIRTTTAVSINGETHFFAMKESWQDTMRIVAGKIDEFGETSDYVQTEVVGTSFTNMAVSGSGSIQTDNALIAVLTNFSGIATMHYLRYNPSVGTVINEYTLPIDFSGPFARTRQSGDSLITYITLEAGGLVRVSASIDNPANYTQQLIVPGINPVGSLSSGSRYNELKIDGAGNEIACAGNILVKRLSNGTIDTAVISNFVAQEVYGQTLAVNSMGHIMVIASQKCAYFDGTLNQVFSGTINHPYQSNGRYIELDAIGTNWYLYAHNNNGDFERLEINSIGGVLDSETIGNQPCKPIDIIETEGDSYLISAKTENLFGGYDRSSVGIIKFDSANPSDLPSGFIEFGQTLIHQNLKINVGHNAHRFLAPGSVADGIVYTFNDQDRSVFNYSKSQVTGMDANQNLYADQLFNWLDSKTGPYGVNQDSIHLAYDTYNRGYYVDREMIDDHIWKIANNSPNYVMPFGIREWPAHGDAQFGQASDLAPFFDADVNGIYEPENGDYPLIYGSKCILNIYHDDRVENTSGLEHLLYTFVFDCDTSDVLNNTVFTKERIIARNGEMTNSYYTEWHDPDIGNSFDDYMGTNVELGMVYAYNGDNYDEDFVGVGFHDTLSAYGVQILQGAALPNDGLDNQIGSGMPINASGLNDGIVDNECSTMESSINMSGTSYPITPAEAYNTAQGLYPNGTPLTVNGIEIRFDYFDDTDPAFYASNGVDHGNGYFEAIAGNIPGDRHIVSSSGSFNLDQSNNYETEILSAYILAIDTNQSTLNNYQPVKQLFLMGGQLKQRFDNNQLGCNLTFDTYISENYVGLIQPEKSPQFHLFPNPNKGQFTIQSNEIIKQVTVYSLDGKQMAGIEVNNNKKLIDLDSLSTGVYLISIEFDNHTLTKRMVVQ